MNGIINKLLLISDEFSPQMHLKKPKFTYFAFETFIRNKECMQKFKGDFRQIYQNELDKVCFQHDMAYGDYEDLARRTAPSIVA